MQPILTRLGVNWPNRSLLADDLPRMIACGFADYVVFLTDLGRLTEYVDAVRALRQAQPGARVHLRIERRGSLDAAADFAALGLVAGRFAGQAESLSMRNEPTLESPGISLAGWTVYLTTLGELVKDPALGIPIFAPPLSPGSPDYLAWLLATAHAARHFAGLWVHAYGTPGQVQASVRAARSAWSGRLICTEYNPGAGQTFRLVDWTAAIPRVLALAGELGVEAICLFTWEWWKPDMALPTSVNVKDSAIETFLMAWRPTMPDEHSPLVIGTGIRRADPLIGPFLESETYDAPGTDHEVAKCATVRGWATWTKATNETVVYVAASGEMWRDWGNHGDATLKRVSAGFLA